MKGSNQRSNFCRKALLAWWITAGFSVPGTIADDQNEAETRPPNIVLIISDDQAWGDFGFMGHPHIETPHLDRLSRESLTFTRGYVPSSLCCPSLATIITGLYPHQHLITGNDPAVDRRHATYQTLATAMDDHIERVPTLPRLLGERGYLSHQSGKWWHGSFRRGGFTHGMTHGDPARGGRHGDDGLAIGRDGLAPIDHFLRQAKRDAKPFFLWYAPFLPHRPHNPPERLLEKYRERTDSIHLAKYWAMCEWFDETCGQLLTRLAEHGMSENTLVAFVTDNGWINLPDASGYAPRSKRSPYEGGIRTPIMLRWPGHIRPARSKHLASSIDLAPTILTTCRFAPPKEMTGINLLDANAVAARQHIFGEVFKHDTTDIYDPTTSLKYRWCIEEHWKLIVPHQPNVPNGAVELYDLASDAHEKKNLANEKPDVAGRLERLLDEHWNVEVLVEHSSPSR